MNNAFRVRDECKKGSDLFDVFSDLNIFGIRNWLELRECIRIDDFFDFAMCVSICVCGSMCYWNKWFTTIFTKNPLIYIYLSNWQSSHHTFYPKIKIKLNIKETNTEPKSKYSFIGLEENQFMMRFEKMRC